MFKQIKLIGLTTALVLASLITGCNTMSSQVLDLHPEIEVTRMLNKEKAFEVIAIDLRRTPVIGYRAVTEPPRPEIVLKNSVHLLEHTTEHALEDMGIRRFHKGDFKLEVTLLDLKYAVKKNALQQTVYLDMKLRVKASKQDKAYTGTYTSDQQHIFMGTPSNKENETIINRIVSETMNLAFNDNQLIDFIQFN